MVYLAVTLNSWGNNFQKLTDEDWTEIRESIPTLPENRKHCYQTIYVDDAQLRVLASKKLDVQLSDEKTENTVLCKIQERIDSLGSEQRELAKLVNDQAVIQVAIPDLGLMTIDYVETLDNSDTETLQEYLDKGWRILAVLPPIDQHYPDYIVGRKGPPKKGRK